MTVVLITGGDDPLVAEAVSDAVNAALGGEDRRLAVEVLTEEDYRVDHDFEIACLVDAAQTAPFLTTRRVVVGRHIGRFGRAEAVGPLVAYLEEPLPTTCLVLVWERGVEPAQQRLGPVPKALTEAVLGTGGDVQDCDLGRGRDGDRWLARRSDEAEIDLDVRARDLIVERIGEDRSRVVGLLTSLSSVFGPGAALGAGDVAPYLGVAGVWPPGNLLTLSTLGTCRRPSTGFTGCWEPVGDILSGCWRSSICTTNVCYASTVRGSGTKGRPPRYWVSAPSRPRRS